MANYEALIIHILIVKNLKYIQIARVCVDSFLYHHPNAKIILHTDESTFGLCKKAFNSSKVNVIHDCSSKESWQVSKMKIALNLSGTSEILVDADLKWNGSISIPTTPTYFVREFTFSQNQNYMSIFDILEWGEYKNYSMKNTSFFSLAGHVISPEIASSVLKNITDFENAVKTSAIENNDKTDLVRIAEQVSLSLLFTDDNCAFLKTSDRQFDGSLVESSYFGATGTRFGVFGATSK